MNTPVVLIIFRRPDLTARVFEAIAEARPPMLLVVSDKATTPEDEAKCLASRAILDRIDWPCDLRTNFASEHMGCRRRVSSGLNWVFDQVEEAIILEDDCLPHPTFFRFCEEMLTRFRDDKRVGHVSGSNFQKGFRRSPHSYYFSRITSIWGWATWRRAWRDYDVDMNLWPEVRGGNWHRSIFSTNDQAERFERMWNAIHEGRVDTWDFQWLFSRLAQSSYAVTPCVNMVTNIGFRPDATHTRHRIDPFADEPLAEMEFPLQHPPFLMWDHVADNRYMEIVFPQHRFNPRRLRLLLTTWARALTAGR